MGPAGQVSNIESFDIRCSRFVLGDSTSLSTTHPVQQGLKYCCEFEMNAIKLKKKIYRKTDGCPECEKLCR